MPPLREIREEIPLLARILQLADIYDALTSVRSYKPALSPSTAIEILQQEVDRGWRDPELVSLFCELIRDPSLLLPVDGAQTAGLARRNPAGPDQGPRVAGQETAEERKLAGGD